MPRYCSSFLCPWCCRAVPRESVGVGERSGWCSSCNRLIEIPFFRIPGRLAGAVAIMVVKLYMTAQAP